MPLDRDLKPPLPVGVLHAVRVVAASTLVAYAYFMSAALHSGWPASAVFLVGLSGAPLVIWNAMLWTRAIRWTW